MFYTPKTGWVLFDQGAGAQKNYSGSAWSLVSGAAGLRTVTALGNITGAVTVPLAPGTIYTATLTGNVTFTWSAAPASGFVADIELRLTQDSTGSRTVSWPANGKWPGASPFVLSTAPSAMDIVGVAADSSSNWIGYPVEAVG